VVIAHINGIAYLAPPGVPSQPSHRFFHGPIYKSTFTVLSRVMDQIRTATISD